MIKIKLLNEILIYNITNLIPFNNINHTFQIIYNES